MLFTCEIWWTMKYTMVLETKYLGTIFEVFEKDKIFFFSFGHHDIFSTAFELSR